MVRKSAAFALRVLSGAAKKLAEILDGGEVHIPDDEDGDDLVPPTVAMPEPVGRSPVSLTEQSLEMLNGPRKKWEKHQAEEAAAKAAQSGPLPGSVAYRRARGQVAR
jgi:hypothetical protein